MPQRFRTLAVLERRHDEWPSELNASHGGGPPMSEERNWLTISDSAAWLIGGMASIMIATTMAYAGWLGASVSELKTDLAKVNAKMDYVSQSTDARVSLGQTMLEDKIANIRIELDKLHHNDEMIGEKLSPSDKRKRR